MHQRDQEETGEPEPHPGERERGKAVERALGDAEVDAPDEGDEEHAEVGGERGSAAGLGAVAGTTNSNRRHKGALPLPRCHRYLPPMSQSRIRNFCIVAHIDHGKSTLADRLIEATGAVEKRQMREQLLDTMDLERERGITIKLNAVRMAYTARDGTDYELNLIDTPGHVDFTYEVSRSLAACEGAILVVDASQGIQAQTLSNLFLAMDAGLEIIPVLNKIDLPGAEPERRAQEIMDLIGAKREEILAVSAKEGTGIPELLEAIVARVPPPKGREDAPLRALIFDSYYDRYRGRDPEHPGGGRRGAAGDGDRLRLPTRTRCTTWTRSATSSWASIRRTQLEAGEVGYLVASLRDVRDARVGDTILDAHDRAAELLPGYREVKSMVFAGLYPTDSDQYEGLRDALEKLRLNDASLHYEPESSTALGFGFRCGFLGLLHMEIVQERLEREFDLDLISTVPTVEYHVYATDGEMRLLENPSHLPDPASIDRIEEPYVKARIMAPADYIGGDHEAGPGAAGRVPRDALHRHHPGRVPLRLSAGRDRARLLRQAEVAQPRLRVAGLRDGGLPASRTW